MGSNISEAAQQTVQTKLEMAIPDVLAEIRRNPLWWARKFTKTFNPQWVQQGFDGPYQPFPAYGNNEDGTDYLDFVFDYLKPRIDMNLGWLRDQIPQDPKVGAYERIIEKSRTMLGTWSCVAWFTHRAQTVAGQQFIFQSQTQEKAEELIDYAKILWAQQPKWLQKQFELDRRLSDFPKDLLAWKNRSKLIAIPSDPDKVRMHHPTGMLMDECAFLSQFTKNRETALPACRMIVMLSSAGPSEFGDFVQS